MRISYSLVIIGFSLVTVGLSINDAFGAGYIKFDGIDGESVDKDHKGWSDLLSISQVHEATSGSLTVRGGTIADEFVIVKPLDKSSPKLSEAIAMGQIFPSVLVDLCTNQKSNCTTSYELTNVILTSYSISGSADEIPVEEILLKYEDLIRTPKSETEEKPEPVPESEPIPPTETDDDSMEPKPRVPLWVQSTAKFWIDKDVSDREFTDALGFLVKEKIIDVEAEPELTESEELTEEEPQVPAWISQTTNWWINGEVPEDQFLQGIKWMIENRIIRGLEGHTN